MYKNAAQQLLIIRWSFLFGAPVIRSFCEPGSGWLYFGSRQQDTLFFGFLNICLTAELTLAIVNYLQLWHVLTLEGRGVIFVHLWHYCSALSLSFCELPFLMCGWYFRVCVSVFTKAYNSASYSFMHLASLFTVTGFLSCFFFIAISFLLPESKVWKKRVSESWLYVTCQIFLWWGH